MVPPATHAGRTVKEHDSCGLPSATAAPHAGEQLTCSSAAAALQRQACSCASQQTPGMTASCKQLPAARGLDRAQQAHTPSAGARAVTHMLGRGQKRVDWQQQTLMVVLCFSACVQSKLPPAGPCVSLHRINNLVHFANMPV
jgi:hypothetical protein